MELYTGIVLVLGIVLAGWALYRAIQKDGFVKFTQLLGYVEDAVLAVEQLSKSTDEIRLMPAGPEKNLLRKNLALSILTQYADKLGIKLTEATTALLSYAIETAVALLPKT